MPTLQACLTELKSRGFQHVVMGYGIPGAGNDSIKNIEWALGSAPSLTNVLARDLAVGTATLDFQLLHDVPRDTWSIRADHTTVYETSPMLAVPQDFGVPLSFPGFPTTWKAPQTLLGGSVLIVPRRTAWQRLLEDDDLG